MTTFVACLALSGCRLDLALDVDLEPDGGGRLAVALAADPEALARARDAGGGVGGGVGGDPLDLLAAAGEDLADEGWTVSDTVEADGTREVELAVEADDAAALSAQATRLAGALSAPEVALLDPLSVTLTDDRILVRGGASLEPGPAAADYGLDGAEAVRLVARDDALGYTVRVTLPAEVLDSNATAAVDVSTLEWTVPPGQRVVISAEGVRPRFPWLPVGGAAAATLLLALVLFTLRRRRRRRRT